jgi:hypothetical protein
MRIGPVENELIHVDGQTGGPTEKWTEMTELIVTFLNFATHAWRVNNSTENTQTHINIMRPFASFENWT